MKPKRGSWLTDFLTSGTGDSLPIATRERVEFYNVVVALGVTTILGFTVFNLLIADYRMAVVTGSAALFLTPPLFVIRKVPIYLEAGYYATFVIGIFFGFLTFSGSDSGSGVLWVVAMPLIAIFLTTTVAGNIISAVYFAFICISLLSPGLNYGNLGMPFIVRVLCAYLYIWAFAMMFDYFTNRTKGAMSEMTNSLAVTVDSLQSNEKALLFEKQKVQTIFENIPSGVFTLDKTFIIKPPFSSQLADILSVKDIENKNFLAILQSQIKDEEMFKASKKWLEVCTSGTLNINRYPELNPFRGLELRAITPDNQLLIKAINASFTVTAQRERDRDVLVLITDVTEELKLQQQMDEVNRQHKSDMAKLYQIMHCDTNELQEFLVASETELDDLNQALQFLDTSPQEKIEDMYHRIHNIKGHAQILDLTEFTVAAHETEEAIKALRGMRVSGKVLRSLVGRLADLKREIEELRRLLKDAMDFSARSRANQPHDKGLVGLMVDYFRREGERRNTEYLVDAGNFDPARLNEKQRLAVRSCFNQFMRNSLAHGFEPAEQRKALGKPQGGVVSLSMDRLAEGLKVTYRDDGRGIDVGNILERAQQIPELAKHVDKMAHDPTKLAKLIFSPLFSMRETADLDAGRGVGLAVVLEKVKEAGGRLTMKHKEGHYLEFSIVFSDEKDAS